jgi:8-oxo-dGTP pyrophosphatase MutT (NUDIX family)
MQILDRAKAASVTPRPASTTLVVRDGADGLEVLMLRRSLNASFMPGAHVFPGGAVDAADDAAACDETRETLAGRIGAVTGVGALALGYAVAALRECFEECGLWLGAPAAPSSHPFVLLRARLHGGESFCTLAREVGLRLTTSALRPWSHWVTPFGLPKRFDTLFFVAPAPRGHEPEVDASETTALCWVEPGAALDGHAKKEFPMEFVTVRMVQSLLPFASVAALLAHAAAHRSLPAVHPRVQLDADGLLRGVVLPGQPDYDAGYQV